MKIFQDPNGHFSWRKAGTALIYILFAYLVIGFAITNDWKETPASYMAVFYLVIAFYFAKNPISRMGSKLKSDDVQPDKNDILKSKSDDKNAVS